MRDSFFIVLAQSVGIIIFAHFLIKKVLFERNMSQQASQLTYPRLTGPTPSQMPSQIIHPAPSRINQQQPVIAYPSDMSSRLLDYADETMPTPVQSDSGHRAANDLDVITDVPKAVKIPPPNDPHILNENLNKLSADSVATLSTSEEDVMNGGIMFGDVVGFENNSSNFFDLTQLNDGGSAYINLKSA